MTTVDAQSAAVESRPMVPVAWAARVSTRDSQDPTLSLPRQLARVRAALPPEFVIVAHFWDIESGRLDLDRRGQGNAHEVFDLAIPRDGGIHDLLSEAQRPDRRFVAVVCESVDRIARANYSSAKIEHELEQAGVALLPADEGIDADALLTTNGHRRSGPRKAGPVLTRRVKQAVAEWYVLNMLELSWGGFIQHTEQGWNIGKPPYGYNAEKVPHPVPAKRAEGRAKHRLVPDAVRGPAVTRIYLYRTGERLGYDQIAHRLNLDPAMYPPPTPVDPAKAVGKWTGSAVREILRNPKYTGYMVWNRRASKSGGKYNPPSEWIWSPQPVHEPVIGRDIFDQAQAMMSDGRATRTGAEPNRHPDTKRSYLFRSYVIHTTCGRRMSGKTRRGHGYYCCDIRPDRGSGNKWPGHPKSVWLREDSIAEAVHRFFATRIFGPDRRTELTASLTANAIEDRADETREQRAAIERSIADLQRRQSRLLDELEDSAGEDFDAETHRAFRRRIHQRFADLDRQIRAAEAELEKLRTNSPDTTQDVELIDALPQISIRLEEAPDELQRWLYDTYRLNITYDHDSREAKIAVTIAEDRLAHLTDRIRELAPSPFPFSVRPR